VSDQFYRAFEDQYRGTRGLVKSRLHIYLPFIRPLKSSNQQEDILAIDLGCGRGEWLELLAEEGGFVAQGVDLDKEMLRVSEALGLKVTQQDAVQFLKALPDASQAIVTGFHIAEHLAFSELQELIKQAHRVLKPAGLLILETPNPENLVVGTVGFYLDPTHQRPIPAQLLAFTLLFYDFDRSKTIRLQETLDLVNRPNAVSLMDVIKGVSPDYAVIAQKRAEPELMLKFDLTFNKQHGVTLEEVTDCYENNINHKMAEIVARVQSGEAKMQAAEARIQVAEAKMQAAEARIQVAEAKMQAAESRTHNLLKILSLRSIRSLRRLRCQLWKAKRRLVVPR